MRTILIVICVQVSKKNTNSTTDIHNNIYIIAIVNSNNNACEPLAKVEQLTQKSDLPGTIVIFSELSVRCWGSQ